MATKFLKHPDHRFKARKWQRGYHPIVSMSGRRRALYGYNATCSCGWKRQSNEDADYAKRLHQTHLTEVLRGEAEAGKDA